VQDYGGPVGLRLALRENCFSPKATRQRHVGKRSRHRCGPPRRRRGSRPRRGGVPRLPRRNRVRREL